MLSIELPNNLIEKWQLMLTDNDIYATFIGYSFDIVYASTISTKVRCFQNRLIHMVMANNAIFCRYSMMDRNTVWPR